MDALLVVSWSSSVMSSPNVSFCLYNERIKQITVMHLTVSVQASRLLFPLIRKSFSDFADGQS